jgi:hypothetical protein
MALRTISATGGNFGSVSCWVEGAVPTSTDHIVGNSTSGNLTLEASRTIQRAELQDYLGTFNYQTFNLTLNSASSFTTFSATMSFTFSTGRLIIANAQTVAQNGTQSIGNFQLTTSGAVTLGSNLYVNNYIPAANVNTRLNSNTLYVNGDLRGVNDGDVPNVSGTTIVDIQGTNNYITCEIGSNTYGGNLRISGSYSSRWGPVNLNSNSSISSATAATTNVDLNILNVGGIIANGTVSISTNSTFNNVFFQLRGYNSGFPNFDINNSTQFTARRFGILQSIRNYTSDNVFQMIRFLGTGGFSFSEVSLAQGLRWASVATGGITYKSPDVRLNPSGTYYIGRLQAIGCDNDKTSFASTVVSTPATMSIGTTSVVSNYNFTDINITGTTPLYALNGTLTRTSNIETTISGTGGGGTSSVSGPYGFAFIS